MLRSVTTGLHPSVPLLGFTSCLKIVSNSSGSFFPHWAGAPNWIFSVSSTRISPEGTIATRERKLKANNANAISLICFCSTLAPNESRKNRGRRIEKEEQREQVREITNPSFELSDLWKEKRQTKPLKNLVFQWSFPPSSPMTYEPTNIIFIWIFIIIHATYRYRH